MKALEKDRNRRYETANDFAADVQRYLTDEPVEACPPSAKVSRCQVRPPQPGGPDDRGHHRGRPAGGDGRQRLAGHAGYAASHSARLMAAELALDKGQLLGESGDASLALLWLSRSLKLAPPGSDKLQMAIRTSLRAWERQAHALRLILPPDGTETALAVAPDGTLVTAGFSSDNRDVTVRRCDPSTGRSGPPLTLLRDTSEVSLTVGFNTITTFNNTTRAGQSREAMSLAVVFSPGADSLLLGSLDRTTRLLDLTTGRTCWETPLEDGYAVGAAFSPDGGKVLIGYAMGWLAAMPQTGKRSSSRLPPGSHSGPPWSTSVRFMPWPSILADRAS